MRDKKYRGYFYQHDNRTIELAKRLSLEETSLDGSYFSVSKSIAKEIVDKINGDLVIRKPAKREKLLRIDNICSWAFLTAVAVGGSFAAEGAAHHFFKVLPKNQTPLTTIIVATVAFRSPFVQYPIAAGQAAINLGLAGATTAVAGGLFKKARRKNGLLDPQELSTALINFHLSSKSAADNEKFVEAGHKVIRDLFNVTGDNTMEDLVASAKSMKALSLGPDFAHQNPEYLHLAEKIRIAAVNALTCLLCLKDQHLSSFLKDIVGKDAADYRKIILEAAEIPEVEEWLRDNLCVNGDDTWQSIKESIQKGEMLSEAQRACLLMLPTKGGLQYSLGLKMDLLTLGDGQAPVSDQLFTPKSVIDLVAAASRPQR